MFHEKLGTQGERVQRTAKLARHLTDFIQADPMLIERAAKLAKTDLVTEMVGEFPELQGLMGRKYAALQGEDPSVAAAIEEHYKPVGPTDCVPTGAVSVALALADKLDILAGFWSINEKPTGSKDPYALRRAALGVIRLILENDLRLPLVKAVFDEAFHAHGLRKVVILDIAGLSDEDLARAQKSASEESIVDPMEADLLSFFADRLKVYLRDQGARHDLIDAVFSLPGQDDLLMVVRRVEVLGQFLDTDDGRNLLAGYKRAANILRIEEKKDGRTYEAEPDRALIADSGETEERALSDALTAAREAASAAVAAEDFAGAMRALSTLRAPVDAFFGTVTVNADDPRLRENRLSLLNALRAATRAVADFSKIEG